MQLNALASGAAEGLRANQEQLIVVDGAASARATGGARRCSARMSRRTGAGSSGCRRRAIR